MSSTPTDRRLVPALILAIVLALLLAAPALAKCGDTRYAKPKGFSATRPPLAIGDSVLYDAVPLLARRGYEANGMICRRMDQGLAILRSRLRRGKLPRKVVLELGANGVVTNADILKALDITGPRRRLVMLTPTDDDPPKGVDAQTIRAAAVLYPGRLTVLDWAVLTLQHPEWMARDGVHLASDAGVQGLAEMIVSGRSPAAPPTLINGGIPAPGAG